VAARAGDQATVQMAEHILAQEKAAADRVRSLFDLALDATLDAQG
jgi:ferritin-like metal-binding protein YciE